MTTDQTPAEPAPRARLVATPARVAATALTVAVVSAMVVTGLHVITHRFATQTMVNAGVILALVVGLLQIVLLYGEESRLSRELRIARSGSDVARTQAMRRRRRSPWFARFIAPPHGYAALLVATGDSPAALDVLSSGSPLFAGGDLAQLRRAVDADARRSYGEAALGNSIRELLAVEPMGSPEADRYRAYVLSRAILELGDALTARDVAADLAAAADPELHLYAAWLASWFELEAVALPAGELRRAALLAKNSGAEDLAERLGIAASEASE